MPRRPNDVFLSSNGMPGKQAAFPALQLTTEPSLSSANTKASLCPPCTWDQNFKNLFVALFSQSVQEVLTSSTFPF